MQFSYSQLPTEFQDRFQPRIRELLYQTNKVSKRYKRRLDPAPKPKPRTVYWMYGNICNLKCKHCDVWRMMKPPDFKEVMTLENKKKVLDNLSDWIGRKYSLNFFAGEIFMHPDIFEVVTHAAKTNAVSSITTNGTLTCTPQRAEQLVDCGLDYLSISLDAFSAQVHDTNRGMAGVRDKVMKTIELLQQVKKKKKSKKPQIWINSIILKHNLDELIQLTKWCKENKLDGIAFQPIASTSFFGGMTDFDNDWHKKSPVWPDYDEVMTFIDTLEKMKTQGFPIKNTDNDFRRFRDYFSDPVAFGKYEPSDHEIEIMVVTREGEVRITLLEEITGNFGNILTDDLDEMWNSKLADAQRDLICESESQAKIIPCKKEDFYFV